MAGRLSIARYRPARVSLDWKSRYDLEMTDTKAHAVPSPLPPSEAELEAWNLLTRDEQIAHYREYLSHPDCERVSGATMADVLAEARARVARRRG